MKVLFIATVTEHIKAFHIPYLKWFKEQGAEVHVATFGDEEIPYCDVKHNISVARSPFRLDNIKAYNQLNAILKKEKYDIIHGHTPMGGILTRLCGKKYRKNGTSIIYTAHGFHFYKGAPLLNWLLYYPTEKWLSKYTDKLITINKEDYELAKQKMKAKNTYYVSGVGIDTNKFAASTARKETKRDELGIPYDATVFVSIGELSKRKNHHTTIKAIKESNIENGYYIIVGRGDLDKELKDLCKSLGIEEQVLFLGYRKDTADLLHMSDVFLFPSLQEGLPVALMEAMAAGLPCVASTIRGNTDLMEDGKGGFLCSTNDVKEYARAIEKIIESAGDMGKYNQTKVKEFDIAAVMEQMKEMYEKRSNCTIKPSITRP